MTAAMAAGIWAAGIVLWLVIRWPYRRRARRTETVTDNRSQKERALLGLTIIGLVIVPALHLTTDIFSFANIPFSPFAASLGLVAMVVFLILFRLSHKHLARNWSVSLEIRKDHELVDTGVYSKIRHPMYTSFWLWGISQFLLLPNWIAGFSGLIGFGTLYFLRVGQEEAMMRKEFGDEYDAYVNRTKRVIPGIY